MTIRMFVIFCAADFRAHRIFVEMIFVFLYGFTVRSIVARRKSGTKHEKVNLKLMGITCYFLDFIRQVYVPVLRRMDCHAD